MLYLHKGVSRCFERSEILIGLAISAQTTRCSQDLGRGCRGRADSDINKAWNPWNSGTPESSGTIWGTIWNLLEPMIYVWSLMDLCMSQCDFLGADASSLNQRIHDYMDQFGQDTCNCRLAWTYPELITCMRALYCIVAFLVLCLWL